MAGLEVVVRPVVLPNIRPAPPRMLAPVNDPAQGFAVISGSGGKLIDLPHSWSVSVSREGPHKEAKRQFDQERVYQVDAKGGINKSVWIDVERLKRVRLDKEDGAYQVEYAKPPKAANVETKKTDVTR